MRLIDTRTLELTEFFEASVPRYATLSHTWEDEEITFQEMTSPTAMTTKKKGYLKIQKTCQEASQDDYNYVWIDTCCIDKKSSAELSECINSMFRYYSDAAECYVYLADLDVTLQCDFGACRWFTRGWTLQELIAPKTMRFYDKGWYFRGTKHDLQAQIVTRTGITPQVLEGTASLQDYSVATRMSWAVSRETSRTEDLAYCLLVIFDNNMLMLYGEGTKAFRRLQEEIIKRDNDMTILDWSDKNDRDDNRIQRTYDLLAYSPHAFARCDLKRLDAVGLLDFSLTNKGLLISGNTNLYLMVNGDHSTPHRTEVYALHVGESTESCAKVLIPLRRIGPTFFRRDGSRKLEHYVSVESVTNCYIAKSLTQPVSTEYLEYRHLAIQVPENDVWSTSLIYPQHRWDATDRIFIRTRPPFRRPQEVCAVMSYHQGKRLFILLDNLTRSIPFVKLVIDDQPHRDFVNYIHSRIWDFGTTQEPLLWPKLIEAWPILQSLSASAIVTVEATKQTLKVSARFQLDSLLKEGHNTRVHRLRLDTEVVPTDSTMG